MVKRRSVWDLFEELEEESEELLESVLNDLREELKSIVSSQPTHVYGSYEACLTQQPAYSVNETEEGYRIVVDLPYVDPSKVSLRLAGRTLVVEAPTQRVINGRCVTFYVKIPLNKPVDRKQSGARLVNGVLVVNLKKLSEVNIPVE
ncbi:MAG: Hsp20/alpha crystallin family protein [Thermoprotei archaeon]